MIKKKYKLYVLVAWIALFSNVVMAEELSPTFLPMLEGEWRLDIKHSRDGNTQMHKCMKNMHLKPIYSAQYMLDKAKDHKDTCEIMTNHSRNVESYILRCDEKSGTTTKVYSLTKQGYDKYVLEKELMTIPYDKKVDYIEKIEFSRVGKCQSWLAN